MTDLLKLKEKYSPALLAEKKEQLETRLATAHQNSGINISELSQELSHITNLWSLYSEVYKKIDQQRQASELAQNENDPELQAMARAEAESLQTEVSELVDQIDQTEIEYELRDPDDLKSVIIEIRAGAGGEEAALFGGDLFRMYKAFAASQGWEMELIDYSLSENGGYKEVIANIKGRNVYKYLKYESGVHRVQRIPTTESSGRIHTSTASVAILPEAQEIDVKILPEDLKIDTMRATGAGGQNVNRTDSAIRITHLPTGIVVSCQETKHQQQNKEKAMELLRARLYEKKRSEEAAKRSNLRSSQIGHAMRAEKIRTYNFPQNRITDHRVKVSWHNINEVMNGNILEMVETTEQEMLKIALQEYRASRIQPPTPL